MKKLLLIGNTLEIGNLALVLGKEPQKRTLPNGREVSQVLWEAEEDLPAISRLVHSSSGDLPEVIDLDGPAPAWLIAALTHECHPRFVRVNSPDGFIPLGCARPMGNGTGENLQFRVFQDAWAWTWVEMTQQDPAIPLDPIKLGDIIPPAIPMGARVILSGRMPNWLMASVAMAYHGRAKAVALFQPGVGSTVAWTHSQEMFLGDVLLHPLPECPRCKGTGGIITSSGCDEDGNAGWGWPCPNCKNPGGGGVAR